jgi:hypothetical protein
VSDPVPVGLSSIWLHKVVELPAEWIALAIPRGQGEGSPLGFVRSGAARMEAV